MAKEAEKYLKYPEPARGEREKQKKLRKLAKEAEKASEISKTRRERKAGEAVERKISRFRKIFLDFYDISVILVVEQNNKVSFKTPVSNPGGKERL